MITCHFCAATVPNVGAAIAADWVPSFYEPGDTSETPDPVCPHCAELYLEQDDDGELVRVADPIFDRRPPQCPAN